MPGGSVGGRAVWEVGWDRVIGAFFSLSRSGLRSVKGCVVRCAGGTLGELEISRFEAGAGTL